MNFVQPIRNKEAIADIKRYLIADNQRDYMLFFLGINIGLRISDLLNLKVSDVKTRYINIKEQKTNKTKRIMIPREVKRALERYTSDKEDYMYLFASRNADAQKGSKPMSRYAAYRVIKKIEKRFGMTNLGTHTLRKTFGYHFYQQFKDVAALQEIYNHDSPDVTLRYIGINQDAQDEMMKKKFVL
ncbi:site-specific integrase [Listeria monocytogenes]|uniref:tyrosine-type recombinase/integrase n=1 Tax=Listeria monocytogenes TaxID=1639 RepID=UPI0010E2642C|nr:tyrosine-type recombinase/integrase [Listeria monocytogenes]EAC8464722.1 site-specific integrase [Listeria monocytogenes]EAG4505960.1 site-specific integrase [Listeria monocytogenes]EKS8445830.1 tyrosine-type recombinase/integrase [Listeria monocytogenes]HAC4847865.1 tyrosine-type recombinase/integrase [Listeria monocytogenes]